MKAIFHRFVRMSRLSMVMLMGILLLAIPAATVHAAPPSLTASQNPVVIPIGQTTGPFTLAWNSGNGGAIDLYGTVNGGPENGPWPGAATGSTPVTITYGDTFVFTMYRRAGRTLARYPENNDDAPRQCVRPAVHQGRNGGPARHLRELPHHHDAPRESDPRGARGRPARREFDLQPDADDRLADRAAQPQAEYEVHLQRQARTTAPTRSTAPAPSRHYAGRCRSISRTSKSSTTATSRARVI